MERELSREERHRIAAVADAIRAPTGPLQTVAEPLRQLVGFLEGDVGLCYPVAKGTSIPVALASVVVTPGAELAAPPAAFGSNTTATAEAAVASSAVGSIRDSPLCIALHALKLLVGHGHTRRAYQPLLTSAAATAIVGILRIREFVIAENIATVVRCVLLDEEAERMRTLLHAAGVVAALVDEIVCGATAAAAASSAVDWDRVAVLAAMLADLVAGNVGGPLQVAMLHDDDPRRPPPPLLRIAAVLHCAAGGAAAQRAAAHLTGLLHASINGRPEAAAALLQAPEAAAIIGYLQHAADASANNSANFTELESHAASLLLTSWSLAAAAAADQQQQPLSPTAVLLVDLGDRIEFLKWFFATTSRGIQTMRHHHLDSDRVAAALDAIWEAIGSVPDELERCARYFLTSGNGPATMRALMLGLSNVDEDVLSRACRVLAFCVVDQEALRAFVVGYGVGQLRDALCDYSETVLSAAMGLLRLIALSPLGWRQLHTTGVIPRVERNLFQLCVAVAARLGFVDSTPDAPSAAAAGSSASTGRSPLSPTSGISSSGKVCSAFLELLLAFPHFEFIANRERFVRCLEFLLLVGCRVDPHTYFHLVPLLLRVLSRVVERPSARAAAAIAAAAAATARLTGSPTSSRASSAASEHRGVGGGGGAPADVGWRSQAVALLAAEANLATHFEGASSVVLPHAHATLQWPGIAEIACSIVADVACNIAQARHDDDAGRNASGHEQAHVAPPVVVDAFVASSELLSLVAKVSPLLASTVAAHPATSRFITNSNLGDVTQPLWLHQCAVGLLGALVVTSRDGTNPAAASSADPPASEILAQSVRALLSPTNDQIAARLTFEAGWYAGVATTIAAKQATELIPIDHDDDGERSEVETAELREAVAQHAQLLESLLQLSAAMLAPDGGFGAPATATEFISAFTTIASIPRAAAIAASPYVGLRIHLAAVMAFSSLEPSLVSAAFSDGHRPSSARLAPLLVFLVQQCEEADEDDEAATMIANVSFKLLMTFASITIEELVTIGNGALHFMTETVAVTTGSLQREAWAPLALPSDADDAHDVLVAIVPLLNGILHHDPTSRLISAASPAVVEFFLGVLQVWIPIPGTITDSMQHLDLALRVVSVYGLWNVLAAAHGADAVARRLVLERGLLNELVSILDETKGFFTNPGKADPQAAIEAREAAYMVLDALNLLLQKPPTTVRLPSILPTRLLQYLCVDAATIPKACELLLGLLQDDGVRAELRQNSEVVGPLRAALVAIAAEAAGRAGASSGNGGRGGAVVGNTAAAYIVMQTQKYVAEIDASVVATTQTGGDHALQQ